MKKLFLSFILFSTLTFSQDAIEVSPSTLDFGNVLMGNTPSLTFTINCNLDQTITITPPSFYSVDITEIAMTDGQTQQVVVTFDPPQVGNFDSQITLAGSTFGTAAVMVNATVVNDLSGSVSGTLSSEFSPYEVSDDLIVEEGNTWTIEAGTELKFAFGKKLTVNGILNIEGAFDNLVKMVALDPDSGWAGIKIENTEGSVLEYLSVNGVTNSDVKRNYISFENFDDGTDNLSFSGSIINDDGRSVSYKTISQNQSYVPIMRIPHSLHGGATLVFDVVFRASQSNQSNGNEGFYLYTGTSSSPNSNSFTNNGNYLRIRNASTYENESYYTASLYVEQSGNYANGDIVIFAYNNIGSNESQQIDLYIDEIGAYFRDERGSAGGNISFDNELSRFPTVNIENEDESMDGSYMSIKLTRYTEYIYYTPVFEIEDINDLSLRMDVKFSTSDNSRGHFDVHAYNASGEGNQFIVNTTLQSHLSKTNINENLTYFGDGKVYFMIRSYLDDGGENGQIFIDNFKVLGSTSSGSLNIENSDNIYIRNSSFTNSITGLSGKNSNIIIKNSVFNDNSYSGISVNNLTGMVLNSILWSNVIDVIAKESSGLSIDYSIFSSFEGSLTISENNINLYPNLDNESFHLNILSPAIDAGHPSDYDNCMPPGKGSLAADIGMYGGMNNCGAQESNLGGGEPSITVVEDMPQDQGGYVGIQFSASHYDGSSNVYDVTHYSVWRELDTDGSSSIEAQPTPDGMYFRLNTRNTNAWEYIGDTPAQEFDNYGYTAPTIADSNHIGMFTSNFLVVAHTDDDDVFFVSEPMDGYSVDNIAPVEPVNVSFATFTYTTTLSWDAPQDEDYAYTEVRRNGEVLASGSSFNQFVDESLAPGESYTYDIVHIDENGNESRNETRDMTAPEWYFEITTQAENAANSIFHFAGNDMASMGYDPGYDLPAPPAPPGEGIRMISYNPSWDNVLGDEYSYISIENVDYMNFNRSVDLEVHSDINDTIPVSVVPYGNLSAMDDFLVYINDELVTDQMNGFYGGSFNLPVSDSTITYVTLVAGNPEGSDGHIQSLTFTDEMVLSADGEYEFNLVTTSNVWQIDIWWSIDGAGANPWRDNMVVDAITNVYTENFSPFQFLATYGYHDGYMPQSPNMEFIFYAEDVNGNRIDTLRSAQVTLIDNTININYDEAGWYLVSPYFVGTDFGDWFNGIDEGSVLYSWNSSMQVYELLNGSDTSFTEGQAMWLGSSVPQVVNYFGNSPELYETKKTIVENNPGWVMTGGSARHVRMDSIVVKLQNISSTTLPDVELSWAEAVEAGIVQNTIIAFENMTGDYEPIEYTKLGQGFWIGLLENGYEETHQVVFEFPPHYVDFEVTLSSRDLTYDWGFTLNNLVFGYSALASNEYDSFDIVSPPTPRAYGIYMRINNEEWNSPLGNSYLSDIRNSIGDDNIAEYEVKFVGTGDYEINTEHFNVPDSLVVTLHLGDESYDLTSNPLVTISVTDGQTGTVSVSPAGTLSNDMDATIPQIFALHQNYPNPFNPTTSISYDLPKNEFVSINVFDLMGREVKTLVKKEQVAGFRSVKWDATNNLGQPVSAGMYIYTIQAGEFRQTRKMVLLK